jgi:hypothetical protein
MFNPWLTLSFKAVQMGTEAQSVVAFRMLHFASGGARSESDPYGCGKGGRLKPLRPRLL